ncbi:MAG: malate synthase A, partial [Chloroflexi bacterium]|nr:malate synthase A [Chloroflexota bacterium]
LRGNISVALQYINSWLNGVGAAAINNLMEDAATAEISRAQIWQWINNPDARLDDGRPITLELVRGWVPEELEKIRALVGEEWYTRGRFADASTILDRLISGEFAGFLTLLAYDYLP